MLFLRCSASKKIPYRLQKDMVDASLHAVIKSQTENHTDLTETALQPIPGRMMPCVLSPS